MAKKYFLLLMLVCGFNANYALSETVSGVSASTQIGQYDHTTPSSPTPAYTKNGSNDSPNKFGFNQAFDIAIDTVDHRLYVVDSSNHRVLVYNLNGSDQLIDRTPDFVLGQSNFLTNSSGTSSSKFNSPVSVEIALSSRLLFVSDTSNHRIQVFDISSITNGEASVRVLGNTGSSGTTASRFSSPMGLALSSSQNILFVADRNNARVLGFNILSITSGEDAEHVLGQSNFTSGSFSVTQSGMYRPEDIAIDTATDRMFVVQSEAHRVTVYDISSITDGEAATAVLGQADFTSSTQATTASGMSYPVSVAYDSANDYLFVGDGSNNRILVFDAATTTNGESAINVIGQSNFTSASVSGVNSSVLFQLKGIKFDTANNLLYAAQSTYNRVSVFDVASITNGEPATNLIGQYDDSSYSDPQPIFTKSGADNSPNKFGLDTPSGVAIDTDTHKLYISDRTNNRVLVFNLSSENQITDFEPDFVLGQTDFYSNSEGLTQSKLSGPSQLAIDITDQRLFVADTNNNRVLVFDVSSISNGENASAVLGQANFTSSELVVSAVRTREPSGLSFDAVNNRLYVADTTNNRVLVFDVTSISNGEAATSVLGQPDFITADGATTQAGLIDPQGVAINGNGTILFVSDTVNRRVLVFDTSVLTNGEAAVNILGKVSYTDFAVGSTSNGFSEPLGLFLSPSNSRLYVSDATYNRVLIFDVSSVTDGESPLYVLGQSNFSTTSSTTTQSSVPGATSIFVDEDTDLAYTTSATKNSLTVFPVDFEVSYASGTFTEALADNGSISNTIDITLKNVTFVQSSGTFTEGVHYSTSNVPSGLSTVITVLSSTSARISFTGTATSNDSDINNLGISFLDAAFNTISASNIEQSSKSDLIIDFIFTPTPTPTATPVATSTPVATATPTLPAGSFIGSINFAQTPLPNVYVNGSGLGSAITQTDGTYSFSSGVLGESYLVTPKKDRYRFSPKEILVEGSAHLPPFQVTPVTTNISKCKVKSYIKSRVLIDNNVRTLRDRGLLVAQKYITLSESLSGSKKTSAQSKANSFASLLKRNYVAYQKTSLRLPVDWLTCSSSAKSCSKKSVSKDISNLKSKLTQINRTNSSLLVALENQFSSQKTYVKQQSSQNTKLISRINSSMAMLPKSNFACK
jgi:DNA-binding beta-propeller fold protein YncE